MSKGFQSSVLETLVGVKILCSEASAWAVGSVGCSVHPRADHCSLAAFRRQWPRFLVSCFSDEGFTKGRSRPAVVQNSALQGWLWVRNASSHLPVAADVTAPLLPGDEGLSWTSAELIHH